MNEGNGKDKVDGGTLEAVKPPKGHHGGGRVIHIHVPFELLERINKVLKVTDMETYSHMGRIGFKRLCEEVEERQKALKTLNPVDGFTPG